MDQPIVSQPIARGCITCRYQSVSGKLNDIPPRCWDCTGTNNHREWEPKPEAPHPYNIPDPKVQVTAPASQRQINGTHYTGCAIQPFQYSMQNNLDPMQHTVIKYVTRFRSKGGVQDLEKAKHTLELLIEWETQHATKK